MYVICTHAIIENEIERKYVIPSECVWFGYIRKPLAWLKYSRMVESSIKTVLREMFTEYFGVGDGDQGYRYRATRGEDESSITKIEIRFVWLHGHSNYEMRKMCKIKRKQFESP